MSSVTSDDLAALRLSVVRGATCTETDCSPEQHVRIILRLVQASPALLRSGKHIPAHIDDSERMLAAALDVRFRHKGSPGPASVRNSHMLVLQEHLTRAVGLVSQLVQREKAGASLTLEDVTTGAHHAAVAAGAVSVFRRRLTPANPFASQQPSPEGDLGLQALVLLGQATGALSQRVNSGKDLVRAAGGAVRAWDVYIEECCVEAAFLLAHWRSALSKAESQ